MTTTKGSSGARSVEHELIERSQRGDRTAFRALYEANVSPIHRYVERRVGRDEADDLTAETFCRAWEGLPRYEVGPSPFLAWLYRIAANLIASRGRRRQVLDVGQPLPDDVGVEGFEEGVVSGLEAADLVTLLARLPERQREVLVRRFLRDESVGAVARDLSLTDEGVRALTYRALSSLRASVRPDR